MRSKSGAQPHIPRWESAVNNMGDYNSYYVRLRDMAVSFFEWINMPPSCDVRFLETTLFGPGSAVFFYDDILGFLTLRVVISGPLNVYNNPVKYYAQGANGYHVDLDETNSVIIYNNYMRTGSHTTVMEYADKLMRIERAIDVNLSGQRTPILIKCSENKRLSLKNLYQKYDGNEPFIFGESGIDPNSMQVLKTDVPFLMDKLQIAKRQYWNEALTFLGIANANTEKKERLVTDEVTSNLGGVSAGINSRLAARKQACKQINHMFGTNIDVKVRDRFFQGGDLYESLYNRGEILL